MELAMTPKEKALQLVNEFSLVGLQQREEGITCALIAVEEILNAHLFDLDEKEYWQQVRTEIANL
jgi:hypothetical protein